MYAHVDTRVQYHTQLVAKSILHRNQIFFAERITGCGNFATFSCPMTTATLYACVVTYAFNSHSKAHQKLILTMQFPDLQSTVCL